MNIGDTIEEILKQTEPEPPQLLVIDPDTLKKMDEARRRAWAKPVWVCHRELGIGHVCGQTFWGEKPSECPRCGRVFSDG